MNTAENPSANPVPPGHQLGSKKLSPEARKKYRTAFESRHPLYFVFAKRRQYARRRSEINEQTKARTKQQNAETLMTAKNLGERWTDADIRFVENHPEMTSKQLALALGRSWAGIHATRQRFGFKTPRERIRRELELDYQI